MGDMSWIPPLAEELLPRNVGWDSGSGDLSGFHFQANSTSTVINELKFAAAKSIRQSVVILASFNALVAFATAAGILWETYTVAKRHDPRWRFRATGFGFIGPAESFPFILSCGIVVQGIVFAVSQAKGLEALLILNCTLISQLMLPAIFITPFIQVVFGLELTFRALKPRPFPSRGKWNITICLVIIGLCLLATFIVTLFVRPPNFCFASLFWFVQRYKVGCFGVLVTIVSILLLGGVVIFLRLYKNIKIDITERIAASRMVYFLAVAIISNMLLIPFFFNLSFSDPRTAGPQALELSLVAGVSANLSGLLTGGLYLFLRSSTITTIGPRNHAEVDTGKPEKGARPDVPSNDYSHQISQPVSPPRRLQRTNSREALIGREQDEEEMVDSPMGSPVYSQPNPVGSNAVQLSEEKERPKTPEPAQLPAAPVAPTSPTPKSIPRKASYSMFPNSNEDSQPKSAYLLPTTTYAPQKAKATVSAFGDTLLPPPVIRSSGSYRHRRDSSLESSATVQIGLRLSNVNDMPPAESGLHRTHDLGCPKQAGLSESKRPSPLASNETTGSDEGPRTEGSKEDETTGDQPEAVTLAPAVYSPEKPRVKVTSPEGVGFSPSSRARANSRASQAGPEIKRPYWI